MRYNINILPRVKSLYLAVVVAFVASLVVARWGTLVAHAANITVTTTDDELNADGDCSLREAIRAANLDTAVDACSAGSGVDTISLPAGTYTLQIGGTGEDAAATGDLDITADATITGAGMTTTIIDGSALDRVFEVLSAATVTISNLTIQNGKPDESPGGGGILNRGATLRLIDSTVSNSTTRVGGGILNNGALFLHGSTVSGNTAFDHGGGIENTGTLSVTESAVSNNITRIGGGIENTGTLTMTNSTLSDNTAERGGGIENTGTLTITNSTLSDNTAGQGGGIDNMGALSAANSTVSHNTASQGGGLFSVGSVNIANTILASNSTNGGPAPDCAGTLTSQRYNLIHKLDGCTIVGDAIGNIIGLDPNLGPLADNGGPTLTRALLPGSPAIDAGNPAPPGSDGNACTATDQRGTARPQDGDGDGIAVCDIGAYELELVPPDATPTSTATPCAPTATPTISPPQQANGRSAYLPLVYRESDSPVLLSIWSRIGASE